MTMTSIDKEIIAVEREYWDSMVSKDGSGYALTIMKI